MWYGTAPVATSSYTAAPANTRPCSVGLLLDLDTTPARMTVFVDGEPIPQQCPYDFLKDREWRPSVALLGSALFSEMPSM
jgi:hypothetical protein